MKWLSRAQNQFALLVSSLAVACLTQFVWMTKISAEPGPWAVAPFIALVVMLAALGLAFHLLRGLRHSIRRRRELEARLEAATGQMQSLVELRFKEWKLSRTEREVALLVIKGLSNGEIAEVRGTSAATTKCQVSAIFRKSGLSSRQQLASMLLEDIVDHMIDLQEDSSSATPEVSGVA